MNKVLKQLKVRTVIGSLIFSVLVFGESVYVDGKIQLTGILWVVYGAVTFGVLLYWAMKFMIMSNKKKRKIDK